MISDLHHGVGECWNHANLQKAAAKKWAKNKSVEPCPQVGCCIPTGADGPHLSSIGFSCKNLSKLFTGKGEQKGFQNWLASGQGSTGETYQFLLQHAAANRPPIIHIENVEELLSEMNNAQITTDFRSIRYFFAARVLSSNKYYVPQTRDRAQGFAIDMLAVPMDEDSLVMMTDDLFSLCATLKCQSVFSLNKFLLDDEDALVDACWKSYVEHARGSLSTDDEASWRTTMQTWRRANTIHKRKHSAGAGETSLRRCCVLRQLRSMECGFEICFETAFRDR